MKFRYIYCLLAIGAFAGCGGSSTSNVVVDPADEVANEVINTANENNNVPVFDDIFQIPASERAAVHTWFAETSDTIAFYNTFETLSPTGGAATYRGFMLAQMGSDEAFLHGDLTLSLNLITAAGSGRLDQVSVSGSDINNEPPIRLDSIPVSVSNISGGGFTGTMRGVLDDNPGVFGGSYVLDIDATLEGQIVDNSQAVSIANSTAILGTTEGTVRINGSAPLPLVGAFGADEQGAQVFN